MESPTKILGHPIHQMLIVFPLGLLSTSVIFDAVYFFGGQSPRWADIAYWMLVSGLIGAVAAAIPGWIDWFAIPQNTRAKWIGLLHGLGNGIGVIGLFGASWFFRMSDPVNPPQVAFWLSAAGLALSGVTAWLGGELVDRLGIGVTPGAHPDAPSSLTRSSAH